MISVNDPDKIKTHPSCAVLLSIVQLIILNGDWVESIAITPPVDALLLVKLQLKRLSDKLNMEYVTVSFAPCNNSQAQITPPFSDALLLSKMLPMIESEDWSTHMTPPSDDALLLENVLIVILDEDPNSKAITPP